MQNNLFDSVFESSRIDYLATTVRGGRIERERIYYRCEDLKIEHIGIDYFDYALLNGKMICFSIGNDGLCTKYDFALRKAEPTMYTYLATTFDYFSIDKIKLLGEFFVRNNMVCDNHVLGIRVLSDGTNKCIGICPYFRFKRNVFNSSQYEALICELSVLFFNEPFIVCIPQASNCRLHMMALDFASDELKLKFYFEFDAPYEHIKMPLVDASDENASVIQSIINENGRLEFFQASVTEKNLPSYNLYFKPRV